MPRDPKFTAQFDARVRDIVREEIASLGGHLLATYGPGPGSNAPLATLGGYLLEHYGPRVAQPAPAEPDPED